MFSVTAKYALRAMAELASLPHGTTLLGKELSERIGVPANYLSKILWALGREGLIDAVRGIRGGYKLHRRPEDIRLVEVVNLFDKPHDGKVCFLYEDRTCSDSNRCSGHDAWSKLGESNRRFLESTTVADFSSKQPSKKRPRAQRVTAADV